MNRMLIGALDAINNLLAVVIILVGAVGGFMGVEDQSLKFMGLIFGLLGGLAVAAVVCGVLAILIEIEQHLRKLSAVQGGSVQSIPNGNRLEAKDA